MKRVLSAIVLSACAAMPCLAQRSTPIQLVQPAGASSDYFGSSVAVSGDTMIVGAYRDDVGANVDQGSASIYRWAGSGWAFEATLTASDGAAGDLFGGIVALSGDTAIVSATGDDIGSNADQGSAYVFVRNGSTWTQQAKLTADDGAANDTFGIVAISGDTVVVGAFFDDVGANVDQGSVYIFTRTGTTWSQRTHLTANDGANGDAFGWDTAISGDDVVIGARGDQVNGNLWQGSAYVFTRVGAAWTQQAKLTASDGVDQDLFGQSVAMSGDTVLIGASWCNLGANPNQGSAYVFTRSNGVWAQQAKLTADDGATNDEFGTSVDLVGDSAVIGAWYDDVGSNNNQGSAYVFARSGSTWTQQAKLTSPSGDPGDLFGVAVSHFGDTAVIGAYLQEIGPITDQGSAWVFSRIGSTWIGPDLKGIASDGAAGDQFGISIAVSGDTAIVGARADDIGANTDQGSAYVFVRSGSTWVQQAKLTAFDGTTSDNLGFSVAVSGDTAVVGAYQDDVGANSNQGSAYVFVRTPGGTTWTQQAKLVAADGAPGDYFGYCVAVSGDTALIGAVLDDLGFTDQGSAYVFTRSGTAWTQQTRLTASDAAASDNFGGSVTISGDNAFVGAYAKNNQQGAAYAFARSGSQWIQQAKLVASDGAAADFFGVSVALCGDTTIVGAHQDDIGANYNQGSAYVFVRAPGGTTWTQQAKLIAADGAGADSFGYSVAVSGDVAFIGSYADDVNFMDQGSAYVFTRSGNVWTQQSRLAASDAALSDLFACVALSGNTAVIGAFSDDIAANPDQGSFYSFDIPCNDFVFAHNDSTDIAYSTLASALVPATSGQQISASQAAFRNAAILDTFGKSLGIFSTGTLRTPSTAVLTLGGSSALVAPVGSSADIFGQIRISGYADIYADSFLLGSRGMLTARTSSSLTINAPLARLEGQTRLEQGASMTFAGSAQNIGPVTAALESDITAGDTITNIDTYSITGATINTPLFFNRAAFNVFGTSAIFGSFTNNDGALTTIRSGSLYVFGSLTNNGTVVGTICAGCLSSPPYLDIGGDLVLGTDANLSMPFADALLHVAGHFDASLNNNTRYDMSAAALQFEGFGGEQTLEVMSADIGPDALGLDRTKAGHFPIGTLHIGPANTTVRLVDHRDNDGRGQSSCEAIYVNTLRIDSGGHLVNPACRIYYSTLVNNGTVDVPENLVRIAGSCLADFNMDGFVDFTDFDSFVTAFEAGDPAADFNTDGFIDFTDFDAFVSAFEAGC